MFLLNIVAIALCVASLQFSAECFLSNKYRRSVYLDDLGYALRNRLSTRGSYTKGMEEFYQGDTLSRAAALENIFNSAWMKGGTSKRLLGAIASLKKFLSTRPEKECDPTVYHQLLSIVGMSDKYFEGSATRDRVIRMLIFKMHDGFATSCVRKFQKDFKEINDKNGEPLDMLTNFKEFFKGETPDLSRKGDYPDNSPAIMNKLKLDSDGDQAWYMFMLTVGADLAAKVRERAYKTWVMPRKERIALELKFVIDTSCVALSLNKRFVAFVHELSSLARNLVFELVKDERLENNFRELTNLAAMYKICMRLRTINGNELVEKIELHTRKDLA